MIPTKSFYDRIYTNCLVACPIEDVECLSDCARLHHGNLLNCPCQTNCPYGCPCPDYICPVPSTEVLVLSTRKPENSPVIINSAGRNDQDFYFEFEESTEISHSCSIFWHNQHYVFGGNHETNQVSKIVNCKLTNVGQLSFSFNIGGCAKTNQEQIYLCFPENSQKACWTADTPTGKFDEASESFFEHKWTRIAASESKKYFRIL